MLQAVERDTLFSAAAVLVGQTTARVGDAFLTKWETPLVEYPEEVHVDAGSQLRSALFQALLRSSGVRMCPSGKESHNMLGAGEQYHSYLRELFKRVRANHPAILISLAVSMLVWCGR